jgi:glutamate-1-semialdehyde 2,1-aminomutase
MPLGIPQFFARAQGARLWDADGREYIDFLCALGPNLFGYGHPHIEAAAHRQRLQGDTMSGPAPVMVELAEKLVEVVSHADWALFAKSGADVTGAALRIARAQTGNRRFLMASGSYHGAHAWSAPGSPGVLPEEHAFRVEYKYNDVDSLERAATEVDDDLAAIFVTAFRHDFLVEQDVPRADFARRCRELCDRTGALLVIDDIRAGFRIARDCSWEIQGIRPDLSCWSKAIANGYPLSALLGSRNTRLGASRPLLTGTYWVQAVPMAASSATIDLIRQTDYLEKTIELGEMLRTGLTERAAAHGFELTQTGPVQMPMIQVKNDPDFRFSMAFASALIARGIYMVPYHNLFLCAAMTKDDIRQTISAADDALAEMANRRSEIRPHEPIVERLRQSKLA